MKNLLFLTLLLLGNGCEPFVVEFPDLSTPKRFAAAYVASISKTYQGGSIKVLTWNMRFGVGRFSFFGDSCGEDVIADEQTVTQTMSAIAETLTVIDPDIVLLQEVDLGSKRTGYWNQIQYLLDNTPLNYGVYASVWELSLIHI